MNHEVKLHKPTGPAFYPGEVWVSCSGAKVEIVSASRYPGATGHYIGLWCNLQGRSGKQS